MAYIFLPRFRALKSLEHLDTSIHLYSHNIASTYTDTDRQRHASFSSLKGKYLPILYEATCNNYFFIKYLLISNVARIILLITLNLNII